MSNVVGGNWGKGGGKVGGTGGGDDDVLKRVEALEKSLLETREKVVRIEAAVESIKQHGATKEDIQKVYVAIEANGTKIEAMGTRVEAMGRTMIQWSVGTAIAMASLAFAAAKLIHV